MRIWNYYKATRLKAVFTETTSFTEGSDLQVAPSAPAELVIPDLNDFTSKYERSVG